MNHALLQFNQLRLIDDSDINQSDIMTSFAIDDTLCLTATETKQPAIHLWVHRPTVVLGIPDSRTPYINDGIQFLNEAGYKVIIRNSGGLAVLLDEGVLNLSLIFPEEKQFDIHDSYQAMVEFIRWLLEDEPYTIDAYEISESYCPGTYDLSINGQKFAGISQRRVKQGTAVQIYLCIEGDGQKRADVVKQFYEKAVQGEETKFTYPSIKPDVMASLEQLLGKSLSTKEVKDQLLTKLKQRNIEVFNQAFTETEQEWFDNRLNLMHKRNKTISS
ncbi:biotin/lipoate A/B protein ligase family protein [Alkalibacillus sp. S2W]|uniref:lipoate--protein ligase family protein n=1 Tax=Alkalibacillus sp. S2W TaxID=3386553 RepID=UPI00398D2E85